MNDSGVAPWKIHVLGRVPRPRTVGGERERGWARGRQKEMYGRKRSFFPGLHVPQVHQRRSPHSYLYSPPPDT